METIICTSGNNKHKNVQCRITDPKRLLIVEFVVEIFPIPGANPSIIHPLNISGT